MAADRRFTGTRSFNLVYKEILGELGENPTFFQCSHAKRLAGVMVSLDQMEQDMQEGKDVDPNVLNRSQNIYSRLTKDLGIKLTIDDEPELTLEDFLAGNEEDEI